MKTTAEKLQYLFSKINWSKSFLDAEAIQIMNTIGGEIEELQQLKKEEQIWKENEIKEDESVKQLLLDKEKWLKETADMEVKILDLQADFIWLFENSNLNMDAIKDDKAIEINKRYNQLKQ